MSISNFLLIQNLNFTLMLRKLLFLSFCVLTFSGLFAQQELSLHFLRNTWQSSKTNPAFITDHKVHYGLPNLYYNIAHTENDIHNPKSNKNNSGFLPEERAWMTKWFENGFTDAFRFLNPEKIEYSWWSYRANARANNKGWRIDYQSVTNNLKDKLVESYHLTEHKHSDHCGVYLKIDI